MHTQIVSLGVKPDRLVGVLFVAPLLASERARVDQQGQWGGEGQCARMSLEADERALDSETAMRPYVQLARLEEIVLEESYVLGVIAEPGELSVDLDFVLTRSHLDYAPPAACEHECFKRGTPNFRQVERLVWEEQGSPPAVDASGERDYGHIDSFEWEDGHYVLAADFGRIDARPDEIEVALTAKA